MKKCCFCEILRPEGGVMRKIAQGKTYTYYRCDKCHWYSTENNRGVEGEGFDYDKYDIGDGDEDEREKLISAASRILTYKFAWLGIKPSSFLDVGCSEGLYVEAYNRMMDTREGWGCEASHSKVMRGIERGLKLVDIGKLPKRTFDFVFMRHVVEHIENPLEFVMSYIDYVNENGGILGIETPNSEDIKDNIINRNKIREDRYMRDLYPPTHVCGYGKKTFEQLEKILRSKGFRLEKIYTYDCRNRDWFIDNGKVMNVPRRMSEKLGLGANLAAFYSRNK